MIKISLPLPPTDNHAYGQRGGRRFMYKEAKDWKIKAGKSVKKAKVLYTEEPIIFGEIHFYLKYQRDIQGSLKLFFDALEKIYYKNDNQIIEFGPVYKHKEKHNPRMEFFARKK